MGLVTDAFPDFFGRCPKTDDERMRFEAGEIFSIRRQTAAGGNNGFFSEGQFADYFFFHFAKRRFAVLGENLRDGLARAGFDGVIGVEKSEVHLTCDDLADGRFAGAHEADQGQILKTAHEAW